MHDTHPHDVTRSGRETHEIVVRGRLGRSLLGPFATDFAVASQRDGCTRFVGSVRDAAHLHGVLTHLASINADVISLGPVDPTTHRTTHPTTAITATEHSTTHPTEHPRSST